MFKTHNKSYSNEEANSYDGGFRKWKVSLLITVASIISLFDKHTNQPCFILQQEDKLDN